MSGERKAPSQRVDFVDDVRKNVARKAMYVCSNPACLRVTGFLAEKGRPRAIAQAAHILPASRGGPRRDDEVQLSDGAKLSRGDEGNAIWLCVSCHTQVDSDAEGYPVELLLAWKREHERRISGLVGLDLEQSLLRLGGERRSHDLTRDLLYWLDSHRFMYWDDSREFPLEVRRALDALRVKLTDMRATVHGSESRFAQILDRLDHAALRFFESLHDMRIDDIIVSDGVPEFERFSESLRELRLTIIREIDPLAAEAEFEFKNIRVADVGSAHY